MRRGVPDRPRRGAGGHAAVVPPGGVRADRRAVGEHAASLDGVGAHDYPAQYAMPPLEHRNQTRCRPACRARERGARAGDALMAAEALLLEDGGARREGCPSPIGGAARAGLPQRGRGVATGEGRGTCSDPWGCTGSHRCESETNCRFAEARAVLAEAERALSPGREERRVTRGWLGNELTRSSMSSRDAWPGASRRSVRMGGSQRARPAGRKTRRPSISRWRRCSRCAPWTSGDARGRDCGGPPGMRSQSNRRPAATGGPRLLRCPRAVVGRQLGG